MKFVIQFFFSFLDEKLFILYLSSSFYFIDILFCFPVPYSIFLYYNSFYVVFFNMIYLPDYLNFYLNLILLCILFFYPTLLFFIKYFLFHIYLRSFFVELLGITTFILKLNFYGPNGLYLLFSGLLSCILFSKILSFVSLFFLFCFCNCMIALLFIFDNTFSEYFICFVNFDILHISYQSLCILYSEYFDYYSFYFISGMIKPFLRHSIYKLNLGLTEDMCRQKVFFISVIG